MTRKLTRKDLYFIHYIEDNSPDVALLKSTLSTLPQNVKVIAHDGGEDVENFIFRQGKYSSLLAPDIYLLDVNLASGVNVWSLVDRIRNFPDNNSSLVVVTSGVDPDRHYQIINHSYSDEYIQKIDSYIMKSDVPTTLAAWESLFQIFMEKEG